MIKIRVLINSIEVQFVKFETQGEADSWVQMLSNSAAWGKPERWVRENQEDISNALETREVEIRPAILEYIDETTGEIIPEVPAETRTEYRLAAEYTIEQIDITAQVEQERINREALAYLASTDWYVTRFAETNIAIPPDVASARAAARVSIIKL